MGTCWITAQKFICGKLRMIQPSEKAEKFSKKLFYDTKVIISIIQPEI